jgi:hypothetical protein
MNDSSRGFDEPVMGRADVLLRFLQLTEKDRPEDIEEYLEELDKDTERRPIADQIVDRMIAGDINLYKQYERARREVGLRNPYASAEDQEEIANRQQALGAFLEQWAVLEKVLRHIIERRQGESRAYVFPTVRLVRMFDWISEETQVDIDYLRRLRNQAVHGVEILDEAQLIEARRITKRVLSELREQAPEDVKPIFDAATAEVEAAGE